MGHRKRWVVLSLWALTSACGFDFALPPNTPPAPLTLTLDSVEPLAVAPGGQITVQTTGSADLVTCEATVDRRTASCTITGTRCACTYVFPPTTSDGEIEVFVLANDGKTDASATGEVNVDGTPPLVTASLFAILRRGLGENDALSAQGGAVSDPPPVYSGQGVAMVHVYEDPEGANELLAVAPAIDGTVPETVLPGTDGTAGVVPAALYVAAEDTVGNLSAPKEVTVGADVLAPVVDPTALSLDIGDGVSDTPVLTGFAGAVTDAESAVTEVRLFDSETATDALVTVVPEEDGSLAPTSVGVSRPPERVWVEAEDKTGHVSARVRSRRLVTTLTPAGRAPYDDSLSEVALFGGVTPGDPSALPPGTAAVIDGEQLATGAAAVDVDFAETRIATPTPAPLRGWTPGTTPIPTGYATFVYDPGRQWLYMFEGSAICATGTDSCYQVSVHTGEGWSTAFATPVPVGFVRAVWDPVGERVVAVSGVGGANSKFAMWGFRGLPDGTLNGWVPLSLDPNVLGSWGGVAQRSMWRTDFAMTFDEGRGQVVLHGGERSSTKLCDTWGLSGQTFGYLTGDAFGNCSGQPGYKGHTIAWNGEVGLILFGGQDGSFNLNFQTWNLGTDNVWRTLGPSAIPNAGGVSPAVWHAKAQRTFAYSAHTSCTPTNVLYRFDAAGCSTGACFTPESVSAGLPFALDNSSFYYDDRREVLVAAGGNRACQTEVPTTTWELTGSRWVGSWGVPVSGTDVHTVWAPRLGRELLYDGKRIFRSNDAESAWEGVALDPAPPVRTRFDVAYDARAGVLVLFGGLRVGGDGMALADTWTFDGTTWARQDIPGPPARYGHAMAHDPETGRTWLFGGTNGGQTFDDTWFFEDGAWTEATPLDRPAPRTFHAMGWDPARRRLVVFGGFAGGEYLGDTWTYDGTNWRPFGSVQSPSARQDAAFAWDAPEARLVLHGGQDVNGALEDLWAFDTFWRESNAGDSPGAMSRHSLFFSGLSEQLVVTGVDRDGVLRTYRLSRPVNGPRTAYQQIATELRDDAASTLDALEVTWVGHGEGLVSDVSSPGARLLGWNGSLGEWVVMGGHTAGPGATAAERTIVSDAALALTGWLSGPSLWLLVEPIGASGQPAGVESAVATDFVSVEARYLLAP